MVEMIDFAYDMLGVAVRAVGAFVFWGSLICGLWVVGCGEWGVATLYRAVVRWVKH